MNIFTPNNLRTNLSRGFFFMQSLNDHRESPEMEANARQAKTAARTPITYRASYGNKSDSKCNFGICRSMVVKASGPKKRLEIIDKNSSDKSLSKTDKGLESALPHDN